MDSMDRVLFMEVGLQVNCFEGNHPFFCLLNKNVDWIRRETSIGRFGWQAKFCECNV